MYDGITTEEFYKVLKKNFGVAGKIVVIGFNK